MTTKAYRKAGALVGHFVLSEVQPGELICMRWCMQTAIARLCCGEIARQEYRWRCGGNFSPLSAKQIATLSEFVREHGGEDRDRAAGEALAIQVIGDHWAAIKEVAGKLSLGKRVGPVLLKMVVEKHAQAAGAAR